jgi:hypothetical protein
MLTSVSFLVSIPNIATSFSEYPCQFSPYANFDFMTQTLFEYAIKGDVEGVQLQLKMIADMLEESDDGLNNSCQFLNALVNKINIQYGTSLTLSQLIQITRESIHQFRFPDNQFENCMVGLDFIELHQQSLNEIDCSKFVYLVKHRKNNNNFWTWLSIATVSVAAVTVCIVVPQVAPGVIGGAVEIGKAVLGK